MIAIIAALMAAGWLVLAMVEAIRIVDEIQPEATVDIAAEAYRAAVCHLSLGVGGED